MRAFLFGLFSGFFIVLLGATFVFHLFKLEGWWNTAGLLITYIVAFKVSKFIEGQCARREAA